MLKEEMERQHQLLWDEQYRAKQFLNDNGFDCTSAPWVLVKQYRDALKGHMAILRMNIEEYDDDKTGAQ